MLISRGLVIVFLAAVGCGDDDAPTAKEPVREEVKQAAPVGEMVDAGVAKRPAPPDAGRRIDIEIPVLE